MKTPMAKIASIRISPAAVSPAVRRDLASGLANGMTAMAVTQLAKRAGYVTKDGKATPYAALVATVAGLAAGALAQLFIPPHTR